MAAGAPASASAEVVIPVTAQLNGQTIEVISAKLPRGATGVYEIDIAIPSELGTDSEAHLSVSQNGNLSNLVTFALKAR